MGTRVALVRGRHSSRGTPAAVRNKIADERRIRTSRRALRGSEALKCKAIVDKIGTRWWASRCYEHLEMVPQQAQTVDRDQ